MQPNPLTMAKIHDRLAAAPEPDPTPVWTVAQAQLVLGSYYRTEYAARLAPFKLYRGIASSG